MMSYRVEGNCNECGVCAQACDLNLITVHENYIEMDIDNCFHCSKCVESCPNGVFTKSVIFKHFIELFKRRIRNLF